jgi:dihydroorotate dehydrogenase electron transfer subunit
MQVENAVVLRHEEVNAGRYKVLALRAPALAAAARPGQFVHLRVPLLADAVLRRPFSIYDADGHTLRVLYKVVGKGTQMMQRLAPGDLVSLMGPLGNGFRHVPAAREIPVLVAGGYGAAPLYLLARTLAARGLVFLGGATQPDILCQDEFRALGWPVEVATEDGSLGERGLVTAALDRWLAGVQPPAVPVFYACGPNGMLKAVGDRAVAGGWQAWLSLDRHMGCGVGACLACVQKVRQAGGTGWARVCKDGPVFEAREVVWE